MQALEQQYGRAAVVAALREEASLLRNTAAAGGSMPEDVGEALVRSVPARLAASHAPSLRPVINATGVIIHTNLGRAPISAVAMERVASIAGGYSNLEYDLGRGERGKRDIHAGRLLCQLTGAEAAVVVNNNAAATLLVLAALAAGREVIVSRGELVEIGGGFRIPEVMSQSGALLREVGTTNRTRAADYAAAIGEKTGLILRVHPSNFRIQGFVERPRLTDLVSLGRKLRLPVVEDQGSGYLDSDVSWSALGDEPSVRQSIAEGADVVMFSGDKLLGGPQAGIIAGSEAQLALIRKHPLMRALRADKMTYAALEATLQEIAAGRAAQNIPVARMLTSTERDLEARASRIVERIGLKTMEVVVTPGSSTVGGGSAPGSTLPTRLVAVTHPTLSASTLEARLRASDPPIIARIEHDRVVLDVRTILPEQDEAVVRALSALG